MQKMACTLSPQIQGNLMQEEFSELEYALICMQNALLGAIVPELRAVTVDIDVETKTLFYFFFYDGEISDKLFDLASVASAEASAHMSAYFVDDNIIRLDFPQKIPVRGSYAYLRKE